MSDEEKDKGLPIPTRFDPSDEFMIATLSHRTKLSKSDIIRRCVKLAISDIIERGMNILYELPEGADKNAMLSVTVHNQVGAHHPVKRTKNPKRKKK